MFFVQTFWWTQGENTRAIYLGHCMVDHVVILALGHFYVVAFFGHGETWTMLVAYGILAILVICDVVG